MDSRAHSPVRVSPHFGESEAPALVGDDVVASGRVMRQGGADQCSVGYLEFDNGSGAAVWFPTAASAKVLDFAVRLAVRSRAWWRERPRVAPSCPATGLSPGQ